MASVVVVVTATVGAAATAVESVLVVAVNPASRLATSPELVEETGAGVTVVSVVDDGVLVELSTVGVAVASGAGADSADEVAGSAADVVSVTAEGSVALSAVVVASEVGSDADSVTDSVVALSALSLLSPVGASLSAGAASVVSSAGALSCVSSTAAGFSASAASPLP